MALQKGGMSVAAYEAKFHTLSGYAMQLVTTEEEMIRPGTESLVTRIVCSYDVWKKKFK